MGKVLYRINLNKPSNRLDQFAEKQRRKRVFAIAAYFAVIIVISGVAVYKGIQTQNRINALRAELQQIQDEIDRLEASTQYLSPEDIFTLAELATNRMTWTEKLDVLGRILPRDVTITGLDYDEQVKLLVIRGITKVNPRMEDLDLVMSIVDVIRRDPNFAAGFSEIKFGSSARLKREGQEIIQFEIACNVG